MRRFAIALLMITAAPALALTVSAKPGGIWKLNDLSKESGLSAVLGGAQYTLVNSGKQGGTTSVLIFTIPAKNAKLGGELKPWADLILGQRQKSMMVIQQKTFRVNNEWRYYAELLADPKDGGTQLHYALLAAVRNGEAVLLDYHQTRDLYNSEIAEVKALYHAVEIENP